MTVGAITAIPPGIARAVVGLGTTNVDGVFFADALTVFNFDMVICIAIDDVASRIKAIHRFDICCFFCIAVMVTCAAVRQAGGGIDTFCTAIHICVQAFGATFSTCTDKLATACIA